MVDFLPRRPTSGCPMCGPVSGRCDRRGHPGHVRRRCPRSSSSGSNARSPAAFRTGSGRRASAASSAGCKPLADGIKLHRQGRHHPRPTPTTCCSAWRRTSPSAASFVAFLALPFGDGVVGRGLNVAVFFMLAVLSSGSVRRHPGRLRFAARSGRCSAACARRPRWSATKCRGRCACCMPVIVAGTLNLNDDRPSSRAGCSANWFVFHDPFTFVAFFIFFTVRDGELQAGAVRPGRGRERTRRRLPHRILAACAGRLFFMAEYGEHVRRQRHRRRSCSSAAGTRGCCRTTGGICSTAGRGRWRCSATCINVVGVHRQGLAAGLRDDVGALDAAAAADRPGDDDLPEIPAADQLRAAAGRLPVAAGAAVVVRGIARYVLTAIRSRLTRAA